MSTSEQLSYPQYSIPDGTRVYAIGDIHGYLSPLQAMHLKIDMHLSDNPIEKTMIVYLGDYVDRGPESAAVVERLTLLSQEHSDIERVFIKGNHEWGMLGFLNSPLQFARPYLKWGGLEALVSYGVDIPEHITQDAIVEGSVLPAEYERLASAYKEKVPVHHIKFLESLELYRQVGGYLFVHAGIKPQVSLKNQKEQDLMRIREAFSDYEKAHEYRVVHGHQISTDVEIKSNRIGLDTGFYEQGVLSCVALEKDNVEVLQVRQEVECRWTSPLKD